MGYTRAFPARGAWLTGLLDEDDGEPLPTRSLARGHEIPRRHAAARAVSLRLASREHALAPLQDRRHLAGLAADAGYEAAEANPPVVVSCLRLETLAKYNPEEDEFEDFIVDLVSDLGVPIIMDFPAGHEVPNLTHLAARQFAGIIEPAAAMALNAPRKNVHSNEVPASAENAAGEPVAAQTADILQQIDHALASVGSEKPTPQCDSRSSTSRMRKASAKST